MSATSPSAKATTAPRCGPATIPAEIAKRRNRSGCAPTTTIWFSNPTCTITAPKTTRTSRPHILIVTGAPQPSHPVVGSKAGGACSCGREPLEDSDVLQDREVHERSHEYLGSEGTACMAHRRHGTDRNARRVCSHIETARHNRVAAMGGACLRDVLELQWGASALALGYGDVAYPETNADRRPLVA